MTDLAVVPAEFVGVWQRREMRIAGVLRDDADVLWLQANSWYADLRIPHADTGGPVEAFAGPASWADPDFTWVHEIDWLGSFPTDVGHLERDGRDLIERGTFVIDGEDAPYEERWVRGPDAPPTLVALAEPFDGAGWAALVRVGDHALALADAQASGGAGSGFAARREQLVDGAWTTVFSRAIGTQPFESLDLDGLDAAAGPGSLIRNGDRLLQVVERFG